MNRRSFLGFGLAATGAVFVPKFGQWYRQGSGLLVPRPPRNKVCVYATDGRVLATLDLRSPEYPGEEYQGVFTETGRIESVQLNGKWIDVNWNSRDVYSGATAAVHVYA